jgi:hypothetical protein
MAGIHLAPWAQRTIVGAALVPAGLISLPAAAFVLDRGPGTENQILPAQLAGMGALGAVAGALMPGIASSHAGRLAGAGVGLLAGVGAGVVGDFVLFRLTAG